MSDLHTLISKSEIFDGWFNIHYNCRTFRTTYPANELKRLIIIRILLAVTSNKNTIDASAIFTLDKKEIHIPEELIAMINLNLV